MKFVQFSLCLYTLINHRLAELTVPPPHPLPNDPFVFLVVVVLFKFLPYILLLLVVNLQTLSNYMIPT